MRGVNRQDIFYDAADRMHFLKAMDRSAKDLEAVIMEGKNAAKITEEMGYEIILRLSGLSHAEEVQSLPKNIKLKLLAAFYKEGLSIRQISRLTGVSRYLISKTVEQIYPSSGKSVGKKTDHFQI